MFELNWTTSTSASTTTAPPSASSSNGTTNDITPAPFHQRPLPSLLLCNSTTFENNITDSCARFDFYLYTVVVGSTCMLGVIGNILSFVVLLHDSSSSSPSSSIRGASSSSSSSSSNATSFLLRGLAVADTLVLVFAVPLYVLPFVYPYSGYLRKYYLIYPALMPYLWPLYLIPYTGAIGLTVLVSLDRYVAVCRPFKSSTMFSGAKVRRHVICVVLFAVIYNIPRFFEFKAVPGIKCDTGTTSDLGLGNGPSAANTTSTEDTDDYPSSFVITDFGNDLLYRIIYGNILYFVVLHGGPLVSLAFFNVKLIRSLRLRRRRRLELRRRSAAAASVMSTATGPNAASSSSSSSAASRPPSSSAAAAAAAAATDRDITVVLVIVVFVFICCQTPTLVDHVLWTFVDESERTCGRWHYYYTAVGDSFAILNSSVNFIVYVLTSRRFRQGLCGGGGGKRRWKSGGRRWEEKGAGKRGGRAGEGKVARRWTAVTTCPNGSGRFPRGGEGFTGDDGLGELGTIGGIDGVNGNVKLDQVQSLSFGGTVNY